MVEEVNVEVGSITDDSRIEKAGEIIASATRWSAAASLVPVPYLDLAALGSVQAKMVVDLSNLYGEKVTKEAVNGVVSVLLGTLLPVGATQVTLGFFGKFVPGYGSVLGALTLAGFGSAATYAIGKVFVRHFEGGGTLLSFKANDVKADLKKEFSAAKA